MKLIRFGEKGKEKPGIIIGEKRYDVSSLVKDYNEDFFAADGLKKLEQEIAGKETTLPAVPAEIRLGSPWRALPRSSVSD